MEITSENSSISLMIGRQAFSDCFIADIAILFILLKLIFFLSEFEHLINEISSTPISIAFSTNHSILDRFFVGAIAT